MSQSEQIPIFDTTSMGSAPSSDPTPNPDHSSFDLNHWDENNLEKKLQKVDLKEEEEKEEEAEAEAEKKDDGERENDKDAHAYAAGDLEEEDGKNYNDIDGEDVKNNEGRRLDYPVRPEAEDCAYYMKTGLCKFGSNCRFNHPVRRKNQAVKEKIKEKDESTENPSQTECKYYLRTGGCKFGKACRYNHSRAKSPVGPILELNFLGLPIRQGEKECPYYMRNGSCKYGANCRFNHPDPTSAGACDPPSAYGNGGSVSSQAASQVSMASWSSPRTLNETAYMPILFSPTQGVPPPNPEWNGYQTTVYPPERSLHPTPSYVMSKPSTETTVYTHHQPQMVVDEFPERPGQPECTYFLKTGDCKFKSNCKYHHPKNRVANPAPCAFNDKGLPLRPDQSICSHYSRYGICKFGPACRFDHSIQVSPSTVSGLDQPPPFINSSATELTGIAGTNGTDTAVQQPV
ncbi:hypothetical protein CRYUN_Cryun19dG0019200 [Craigia yunnanensis]